MIWSRWRDEFHLTKLRSPWQLISPFAPREMLIWGMSAVIQVKAKLSHNSNNRHYYSLTFLSFPFVEGNPLTTISFLMLVYARERNIQITFFHFITFHHSPSPPSSSGEALRASSLCCFIPLINPALRSLKLLVTWLEEKLLLNKLSE